MIIFLKNKYEIQKMADFIQVNYCDLITKKINTDNLSVCIFEISNDITISLKTNKDINTNINNQDYIIFYQDYGSFINNYNSLIHKADNFLEIDSYEEIINIINKNLEE